MPPKRLFAQAVIARTMCSESAVYEDVVGIHEDLRLGIVLLLRRDDADLDDDAANLVVDGQLDVAGHDELVTRREMNLIPAGDIPLKYAVLASEF